MINLITIFKKFQEIVHFIIFFQKIRQGLFSTM